MGSGDISCWWMGVVKGLYRYRDSAYERVKPCYEEVWREGESVLLSHGGFEEGGGCPVVFVPSLINGSEIGDLLPERSMVCDLRRVGFRPFLMDWGESLRERKALGFEDYSARLLRMCRVLRVRYGKAPLLLGHCLGSVLSLGAGLEDEEGDVGGLVLLSVPWDMGCMRGVDDFLASRGVLHHDTIRYGFLQRDMVLSLDRFRLFGEEEEESEVFIALQDWLSGGYDLSVRLADDVRSMCGRGLVFKAGGCLRCPCTLVLARDDTVTPPLQSMGVVSCMEDVRVETLPTGHVGAVVGRYREATVGFVQATASRARERGLL